MPRIRGSVFTAAEVRISDTCLRTPYGHHLQTSTDRRVQVEPQGGPFETALTGVARANLRAGTADCKAPGAQRLHGI